MQLLLDRESLKHYNQDVFANTAVKTLFDISQSNNENSFAKMFQALEVLQNQQPQNIVLKNAAKHFLFGLSQHNLKEDAKNKYHNTIKTIKEHNKRVTNIGSKKIRAGTRSW